MMRYFENIVTGALCEDFIAPMYSAYWREITPEDYEEKLKRYMDEGQKHECR